MNTIISFLIQVSLAVALTSIIVSYIRPYLRKVLVDLCGTEERAQFWTVFSNIILVGLPLLISLTYQPEANKAEELFFEITHRISGNMLGFLFSLLGVGLIVSVFALVAPRQKESK